MKKVSYWMLTICCACVLGTPVSWASTNPVDRTKALVEAFKAVKAAPSNGAKLSEADKKHNAEAFEKLDSFFAFDKITTDPITVHQAKFTKTNHVRFTKHFRELIRLVAYPNSGEFLKEATLTYKKANRVSNNIINVDMDAVVEKEDFSTTVTFHWQKRDGTLKIVDVSFDGASLVKDYQNQFGRIINKDGVAGLIKKLETRLDKERKTSVAAL